MRHLAGCRIGHDHAGPCRLVLATNNASEYGRLLAERDRLIAGGEDPADLEIPLPPFDPDPRHVDAGDFDLHATMVWPGDHTRRRRRTYGLPVLLFACLLTAILTLLVTQRVLAASRAAHQQGSPAPVTPSSIAGSVPGAQPESPAGTILEPLLTPSPAPRAAVEQPGPELVTVTPRPVVVDPPKGYAGWHRDPNVSWYGPGFYGQRTACGQTLTEELQGVAHKTLPCGTLVTFRNAAGVIVTVPVIDRGPYVAGRQWDLTGATCLALDHCFTGPLDWRLR